MSLKLGVALVSTSSFYESFWANVFFLLSFIYGNLPAAGSIEPYSLLGGFAGRRPDYITKFICCLTDKFASAGPINTKLTSYLLLCRTNCRSLYRVTDKPESTDAFISARLPTKLPGSLLADLPTNVTHAWVVLKSIQCTE